jgi:hypothetical protein
MPPSDEKTATFRIVTSYGPPRTVRAAYVTTDDDKPGWTLFKDRQHKIVFMVQTAVAATIERFEETDPAVADGGGFKPTSQVTAGLDMSAAAVCPDECAHALQDGICE